MSFERGEEVSLCAVASLHSQFFSLAEAKAKNPYQPLLGHAANAFGASDASFFNILQLSYYLRSTDG